MAGTREGLILRAQYSWNTVPVYLLKCTGTWAESTSLARETVFGTELETTYGKTRQVVTYVSSNYNATDGSLETSLTTTLAPTDADLIFNRMALVRGGKALGGYTGDFSASANTYTITSALPVPFSIGDKFVAHTNYQSFTVDGVSGSSSEILHLAETVSQSATGIKVSDATGTLMVLYVFPETNVSVLQNNTSILTFSGFSFTS